MGISVTSPIKALDSCHLEVKTEESQLPLYDNYYYGGSDNALKMMRSYSSNSFQQGKSSNGFLYQPTFDGLIESSNLHSQLLTSPDHSFSSSHMRRVCSTGDLQALVHLGATNEEDEAIRVFLALRKFAVIQSSSSTHHLYMLVAMTAVKQSSVTGDFRKHNDRKTATLKVFEECDPESYGSSSEETETYSPKSVVSKARKWPATVKDVNVDVFGRRTRNQIERIRAEDSHLGEDIGECLIAKRQGCGEDEYDSVNTQHLEI
ncbi:hypothetical protein L2E82_44213 [Cichorium intybus]|uniref:Uncharacterized protein n=1 Tax=Cichorium intybus TaxID=13427 RepID=A0ACB8ZQ03_CICIN|nr:hypothetical protein L2E82_44213 [Cichorium intybus]